MAALLPAAFVAILALPAAAGAEDKKVTIKALYKAPACPSGDAMLPLPGAKLAVEFGGRKVSERLDKKGTAELRLKGSGKEMKAKVTLDGKLLSVKPYGEKNAHSYSDELKLGDKKTYKIKITRLGKNGAASAWAILSKGVDLAERSMPAGLTLPPVTARYDRGRGPSGGIPDLPGTQTAYDSDTREIAIDSTSRADEFEPWVLLHEYGHHLLETVASPGPSASGSHNLDFSYPGKPALMWSEGFAHAFAALALKTPVLGTLCRGGVNLSTEPATPQSLDDPRFNQYHEISIAGVVWALAQRFGGGDAQAGLKPLLSAFDTFRALNGGPESLREARDALIESGLESTEEEHQGLTELFARHKIGWAFHLEVAPGRPNRRVHADGNDGYRLKVEGPDPYGTCEGSGSDPGEAPDDWLRENNYYYGTYFGGTRGASGALDYAWQDDCYTRTMVYPNWGTGYLDVPYPAPSDRGNPEAPYTVYVRWICESGDENPCSSSSENVLEISRGAWVRNSPQRPPGSANRRWWLETYGTEFSRYVNLPLDAWTPVVEFDALGRCTSLLDGGDCGV